MPGTNSRITRRRASAWFNAERMPAGLGVLGIAVALALTRPPTISTCSLNERPLSTITA